jgi:hypothetical protein
MKALRIPQWHIKHGPPDTRVKTMKWVTTPISQESLGLIRLKKLPNGLMIYGVYQLLVQLAAVLPVKGVFWCDRGAMTFEDIAERLHIDEADTKEAIEVLLSKRIKWLDEVEIDDQGNPIHGWPVHPDDAAKGQAKAQTPDFDSKPRETPGDHRDPQGTTEAHRKNLSTRHEHEHDTTGNDITRNEPGHGQNPEPAPVNPGSSDSLKKISHDVSGSCSPGTPDDDQRRRTGRVKWTAKVMKLMSNGGKQRQSDITSAENLFNFDIWPEGIEPDDGEQALKNALELADRASRANKPMAWLTSQINRARAPSAASA